MEAGCRPYPANSSTVTASSRQGGSHRGGGSFGVVELEDHPAPWCSLGQFHHQRPLAAADIVELLALAAPPGAGDGAPGAERPRRSRRPEAAGTRCGADLHPGHEPKWDSDLAAAGEHHIEAVEADHQVLSIIYADHIWTSWAAYAGWRGYVHPGATLRNRGNAVLRHLDHVHVAVESGRPYSGR